MVHIDATDRLAQVLAREMCIHLRDAGYSEDTCQLIFCRLTDVLQKETLGTMVGILDTYDPRRLPGPQASRKGEHE